MRRPNRGRTPSYAGSKMRRGLASHPSIRPIKKGGPEDGGVAFERQSPRHRDTRAPEGPLERKLQLPLGFEQARWWVSTDHEGTRLRWLAGKFCPSDPGLPGGSTWYSPEGDEAKARRLEAGKRYDSSCPRKAAVREVPADIDAGVGYRTPLVLGMSPPRRGSMRTAWSRARANALKQASIL